MFMTASITIGAMVWLVVWAVTQHGIIALIPFAAIVLTAALIKVLLQYLPSQRS